MAYIGKKMSVNAFNAHKKGLFVLSYINADFLKKNNFKYSIGFFKWLCNCEYIKPSESHHTSACCNLTRFYSVKAFSFANINLNLDILYKLYLNKLTLSEIQHLRGIKFAKVLVSSQLLNINGGPIEFHCVRYRNKLYWSINTMINLHSSQVLVLEEYDSQPTYNWNNKNCDDIIKILISNKRHRAKNIIG